MNDPEILALLIRQLDLSGSSNKILKAAGIKTFGDLAVKTGGELSALGFSGPALRELGQAFKELGIVWEAGAVGVSALVSNQPVTPALPKWILALCRPTFVLVGWQVRDQTMPTARCGSCGEPLLLLAHLNLSHFPDSQLPQLSLCVGRCDIENCAQYDPRPHHWVVRLEDTGGDRPSFRREHDYPGDFDLPKLPGERASFALADHKNDTIGTGPRVGGWPTTAHATKPWPACPQCGKETVQAFESHTDDGSEHVFICPSGCRSSGTYRFILDV